VRDGTLGIAECVDIQEQLDAMIQSDPKPTRASTTALHGPIRSTTAKALSTNANTATVTVQVRQRESRDHAIVRFIADSKSEGSPGYREGE
jgi:hypothetical protein